MKMKRLIIAVVLIVVAVAGVYFFLPEDEMIVTSDLPTTKVAKQVVGTSVEGRSIEMYTFGEGESDTRLLFVGGVHGGYEWNSVLLAYQFIDHFTANYDAIPEDITVSIIPNANPDGVFAVIGKEGRFTLADVANANTEVVGRFNANDVDLNRNFDCKWEPESSWRGETVSAGAEAFSEPEAQAIRAAVKVVDPEAVVFWHSQADAVYASECEDGILPETLVAMNAYAQAAGYDAVDSFDAYSITGDAEGWLASIGIPAITVELSSHETIEWNKNLAGTQALFDVYSHLAK